jgi:hypothetical protein
MSGQNAQGERRPSTMPVSTAKEEGPMLRDQLDGSEQEEEQKENADGHSKLNLTRKARSRGYLEDSSQWIGRSLKNEYIRYTAAMLTGKAPFLRNLLICS